MTTVHAPHCPRPHPKRGPFSCNSFRSTYNSGVLGSVLTVRVVPFTVSVIEAIAAPSVVASLNVVLPDRRTFPKTSLERILERYAMALEEGSGRPLRGDD